MTSGRVFQTLSFFLILVSSLAVAVLPAHAAELTVATPDFASFVTSVKDGQAGTLRGVYVSDLLALKVIQQPAKEPGYVAPVRGTVTEFGAAKAAGNVGLLAHNYLSGADFSALQMGQEIRIVYGDGKIETFKVTKILRYQNTLPKSTQSDFIDLETGEKLSATHLFEKVYQGSHHLTFQTCISQNGESSWGRLFVIAEPIKP